mmetsp:Transcript_104278/g.248177  ORF Transcript_104278/g.248177 Transcript_104278/m.248177 type:complete len:211 (-) Transcript_104278:2874-3506(-)
MCLRDCDPLRELCCGLGWWNWGGDVDVAGTYRPTRGDTTGGAVWCAGSEVLRLGGRHGAEARCPQEQGGRGTEVLLALYMRHHGAARGISATPHLGGPGGVCGHLRCPRCRDYFHELANFGLSSRILRDPSNQPCSLRRNCAERQPYPGFSQAARSASSLSERSVASLAAPLVSYRRPRRVAESSGHLQLEFRPFRGPGNTISESGDFSG